LTEQKRSKISIWIEAIRLRTLPLSVAGILTGSALAFRLNEFDFKIFIPALLTTLLLQILSNLANDFGDAEKGADGIERIGPQRMVQSGLLNSNEIQSGILLTTILALFTGTYLLYNAFGALQFNYALSFFFVGVVAIWAAIKYTMGKNAYGYLGLGDVFVMVFFGFISVAGSFFLYTHEFTVSAILQALTIGSFSTGVLHLNNMRDMENDKAAGKMTLAVKLGLDHRKKYFYALMLIGLGSSITDVALTALHFTELIHLLIVIPIGILMNKVAKVDDSKDFNKYLKPLALSTFAYSVLLLLSFVL